MIEAIDLMALPFLACLILTLVHAYLGLHVIERGVIFVDLALAQIAAFGATVGVLLGWGLHSITGYFCALGFTTAGAACLAFTRPAGARVPQEALIGIVYVMAAAASVLVLSRVPEGGEELRNLMVGHLLFIDWHEVASMAILYSLVAVAHWFTKDVLWQISTDPQAALASGRKLRLWDFFFYATFGLVVTSSTEVAGVLLVFSFLIVPAVCGSLLAHTVPKRLMIGWGCGAVSSLGGLISSYYWDLPSGAAIVCAFGICLVVCALFAQMISLTKTARYVTL